MPLRPFRQIRRITGGVVGQTVWVAASRIVSNLSLTGVAVLTARRLGVTGRGALVLLVTVGTLISLLASLGVALSGRVHLVTKERPIPLGDYLGLCAMLALAAGLLSGTLGAVSLKFANVDLSASDAAALGLYGAMLLAARSTVAALSAYGYNRSAAIHDALGSLARLVAVAAVTQVDGPPVAAFLVAMAVGDSIQIGTSLTALKSRSYDVRPRLSPTSWNTLIRSGMPGIGITLGQALTFRADRYVIGVLLSPAAVGVYSVAATVTEIIRIPGYGLGQVLFHGLASGRAQSDYLRRSRRWCLLLTGLGGAIVFLAAPTLVRVLFGNEFAGSVAPLRVLILAEMALSSFLVDGVSLAALRRPGLGATAAFVAVLTLLIGDIALVPHFGVVGAAWASVLAYLVMAIMARRFLVRMASPRKARASARRLTADG